ncbi:N-acetylmuramoyl-L-alanine amidase [Corynebacterium aquatimens]|uniref:N-acetylmuramoyl-L-alanine amidase n=1 Tax=Corynebacterium aquatimens TaxID=1190508 RepID=UPI002541DF78|nr:N-acetylmuramoyl-L-alanine amidase [Corynebacterium aquatimens]QYH19106.1 N-acetylmuramoyl-L-alanine amidase [Corynebacterium aquatimens]
MQQRRRLNPAAPAAKHPLLAAVVAAILTVAVVAAAMVTNGRILQVQNVGPANIEVYSDTDSFAAGADITVDDAAIRTQGGGEEHVRRVVKEFTRDREFSIVGLTWKGDRDIAAYVRAERPDGSWSEWYAMDPVDPPAGSDTFGTEPIYVEPTRRVQVSTGNVDMLEGGRAISDAPNTALDLNAVFLDGGTGMVTGDINPVADSYTRGMPKVITRAQWGAGASRNPTYTEPVTAATVHHTAGSNNYTEAQAPGIVRGIWHYHAITNNWGDMGYNALVDKYGNIYEGRAGGLDRAVQGAHVGAFNSNTWGVSVLGNYMNQAPSEQAIDALGEIIGWKAAVAGFDPLGYSYHVAEGNFRGSRFSAGQGKLFPNINAHRDFHYNDCPGDVLYARMPDIRRKAAVKYNALRADRAFGTQGWLDQLLNPNRADRNQQTPATQPGQQQPAGQAQTQQPVRTERTVTNSITTPDGTTTTVTKETTQTSPATEGQAATVNTQLFSELSSGDSLAIATVVGTVAGVALVYAFQQGMFDDAIKNVGGTELLAGVTVKDLTPYISPVLKVVDSSSDSDVWMQLEPILGKIAGAMTGPGGTQMAFYANGIGVRDTKGQIFALVGEIANAWLQQGLDAGPLGLPISAQTSVNADQIRMDFEGGAIVFTPSTKTINIITR